jgi:uncharacterized membrane protein YidH (DUF202 family)
MSADRTLMSVIRTSLSLIGFGFTIYQVFQKAHEAGMLKASSAALHFGIALVVLGIAMLVVGIGYHVVFMYGLRRERPSGQGHLRHRRRHVRGSGTAACNGHGARLTAPG